VTCSAESATAETVASSRFRGCGEAIELTRELTVTDASFDPAAHYDRVTDAWGLLLGEELHYGIFAHGDEPLQDATAALTDAMLAAADIQPGMRVLDIGCGTGAPACRIAAQDATVIGITTSAVGVAAATRRVEAAGLAASASFELRDGTDNGFPDSSFDRVWVLESSHLMRARGRLLAECARVLVPGGRLALCDVMLRRAMPFDEVRSHLGPLTVLREVFGDAYMEPMERYVELAERNGLVVDRADDLTAATRATFDRWRTNARANQGAVSGKLGVGDWEKFIEACDTLERFWDGGVMGYGLLAASKPR
jgi:cyclopropane fatty-acyl-phospholipid synthase-like methyltransferase